MKIRNLVSRRSFVTSIAAGAGTALLPSLGRFSAAQPESSKLEEVAWKARPFALKNVRWQTGPARMRWKPIGDTCPFSRRNVPICGDSER